jgi:hypothetical protein
MSQSLCCARAGVAKRISSARHLSAKAADLRPIEIIINFLCAFDYPFLQKRLPITFQGRGEFRKLVSSER